jgi:hypothetical protein
MPNSFWAVLGVMSRMRRGVNTGECLGTFLLYMIGQKGVYVKRGNVTKNRLFWR